MTHNYEHDRHESSLGKIPPHQPLTQVPSLRLARADVTDYIHVSGGVDMVLQATRD